MTTENIINAPATAQPIVPATVADKVDVTYNTIPFALTRMETAGKGEKAAPVAYWGLDRSQFALGAIGTKTKDGREVTIELNAEAEVSHLAKLLTWDSVADMVYAKLNTALKASQLKAGKDEYSMGDKVQHVKDYIAADWGANSKGGVGAIKALKDINTRQAELMRKLVELHTRFSKASPTEAATIMLEIAKVSAEATTMLGTVATK